MALPPERLNRFARHIVLPELLYRHVVEVDERIGAHGTPVIFVHPKNMGGVLVELMETPKAAH